MRYSNFANHAAIRQALADQFQRFVVRHTGGLFQAPPMASGRPHSIDGVPGASYLLDLDPHQPAGVHGHVDGFPGGRQSWRPDFRDETGFLDGVALRWAAGGAYREAPLLLPTPDLWRFLPGTRLRSRRDIAEARILQVRPVALAAGGRPEALASVQIVVESRLGQHLLMLPCLSGAVPPSCGRLEPGGQVLLVLRRFGLGAAAVTGVLSVDQVGVALVDDHREVA